jgi:4-amino-4-deoxy-L-arabinose transferase-like glycosyltransferase
MDVDLIMAVDVIRVSPLESSAPDIQRQRVQSVVIATLIIFAFAVWLGLEAPRGILSGTDELLTAERTREMLMTEPWVVHYNFIRSFEKPPLQYWLTGLTLPRFQNRAMAVRIWPLVYGVLTAIALGWLVYLVKPEEPWLIPLTVAILLSAPLFSTESARGLLDIGLAFFTVLTIAFAELARKKPVWWLAVAVACWLGSLQKIPLPFLVWILIVLVRLTNRDERGNLRNGAGWLVFSMILAIALMSIWPLLQLIKYGMPLGSVFHEEVVVWLGPTELGRRPYFEILIAMSLHPGGLCGFLSLIALSVILFFRRERAVPAVREIALVTLTFLVLTIVFNFRHIRYAIPVLPSLCFLLAVVFYRFLKQRSPIRTVAIAALVVLLTAGFVHAKIHIDHRRKDVADEKMIAEKLGQLQQAGTKTVLINAIIPGNDLMWDSFYLFHGNFRFPVGRYTLDEVRRDPPKPPVIGACIARDFPVVKELYPNVQVRLARAQFICWQVPAE